MNEAVTLPLVKIRAFIFDDDEIIRTMLGRLLMRRGYEVFTYTDPGGSSLYLRGPCPCLGDRACGDIILSDINMLQVSGLAFMENQVKWGCKLRNWALMSGVVTPVEIAFAQRLGCHLFRKPFTLAEMQQWLEACEQKISSHRELDDWFQHCPTVNELCQPV